MVDIAVRRARAADADTVTDIMNAAFMHDPVSAWLLPDLEDRACLHPGLMRLYLEHGLEQGEVYLTDGGLGATIWFPVQPDDQDDPAFAERAIRHLGRYGERLETFVQLVGKHHPMTEPHWHLHFICVLPSHQGRSIGTALLRDRFRHLDAEGHPSYLESSSVRSAALYAREGYQHQAPMTTADGGLTLFPMWRRPAASPMG